jgi:putative DNA modification/repair radical SAM protein
MQDRVSEKLKILADAAKYDVSCSSSGSKRANKDKGLGNTDGIGICHSYTEDGRCVSLLKILLTNHCIYDCAYCVSRRSNDIKRAAFTVEEVVDLTISFYRRNYIEGLFLSSGIFKNADYTTERLVRVAKTLRTVHNFNGYIHLKVIPNASPELLREAGLYADRLSVNLEIPSEESLKKVAPEKNYQDVLTPMNFLKSEIAENIEDRKTLRKAPLFSPAGQSTQLVIGATPENDLQILTLANGLYKEQSLKRVYYSGYVPIETDQRIPVLKSPPLIRENRLYQADWLLRFYKFSLEEIVDANNPNLEDGIDPKLSFALRNPQLFPVEINSAPYEMILKVPGIGVKSARMILQARKFQHLTLEHLKKIGVACNRARYFITGKSGENKLLGLYPEQLRIALGNSRKQDENQLALF